MSDRGEVNPWDHFSDEEEFKKWLNQIKDECKKNSQGA